MSAHVRVCVCQNGCQLCVRALVCVRGCASVGVSVPKCVCECACRGKLLEWSAHFKNEIDRAADTAPEKQKKKQNFILASLFYPATPSCCRPHLGKLGGNAGMCVCVRANFLSNLLNASCSSLVTLLFIHSVATATACWTFRRKGKQNSPRKNHVNSEIPIG